MKEYIKVNYPLVIGIGLPVIVVLGIIISILFTGTLESKYNFVIAVPKNNNSNYYDYSYGRNVGSTFDIVDNRLAYSKMYNDKLKYVELKKSSSTIPFDLKYLDGYDVYTGRTYFDNRDYSVMSADGYDFYVYDFTKSTFTKIAFDKVTQYELSKISPEGVSVGYSYNNGGFIGEVFGAYNRDVTVYASKDGGQSRAKIDLSNLLYVYGTTVAYHDFSNYVLGWITSCNKEDICQGK